MILLGTGALDLQTYVALSENRVRPKSMAFRLPFALKNCSSIDASNVHSHPCLSYHNQTVQTT